MSTKDEQIVKVEGWAVPQTLDNATAFPFDLAHEERRTGLRWARLASGRMPVRHFARPAPDRPRGSTQVPRVWTEGEVMAMMMDMRAWISPDDGEEGNMWSTRAALHGFNLPTL